MRKKGRVELAAVAAATQFTDGMRLITEFHGKNVQPELAKFIHSVFKQAYCTGYADGGAEASERADMATQDLERMHAEVMDALAPYQPSDFEQSLVEAPRTLGGQIQRCIEWGRMTNDVDLTPVSSHDPIADILNAVERWTESHKLPKPESMQWAGGELSITFRNAKGESGRLLVDRQSEGVRFNAEADGRSTGWSRWVPPALAFLNRWLGKESGGQSDA